MNHILSFLRKHLATILILVVCGSAAMTYQMWFPGLKNYFSPQPTTSADDHQPNGHSHDHADHDDSETLSLSDTAWKNIGLTTAMVELQTYVRTVSVPAMVVERPGRSQVEIAVPLTGQVTRVYPIEGEAVQPGDPLFDIRLTHKDLVNAQRTFLQSAEELDVIRRELVRLESVGEGVIAGRRILEQKYEQQKVEAAIHAQRQGLLLHGLSGEQIDEILATRRLLPMLTVTAPPFDENTDHLDIDHLYHVQSILVKRGQSMVAGQPLALLADHCMLYVEGQAFGDDAHRLIQAAHEGWLVDVSTIADGRLATETTQLTVDFVADHVDSNSRALRFYLSLPNKLARDDQRGDHRYVAWHFRPGQRMEIKLPIGDPWTDQIVLPPEAVAVDGADVFVFEQDADHFHRVAVHVLYRDKDSVVVENDGTLIGATLAMSGAYQMQLAIKNKLGGGVDPHAGHTH